MKTTGYWNPRCLWLILPLLWGTMAWTAPVSASPVDKAGDIKIVHPPLRFEVNEGQTDPQVRFIARDRDGIAYLTAGGAVLQIPKQMPGRNASLGLPRTADQPDAQPIESSYIYLKTRGSNPTPGVAGLERMPGAANYLLGNDRQQWRTQVPGFAKIKYEGVYPGIDLVYYGNQEGHLEYDFIVAPGADPDQIAVSVEGAREIAIDPTGGLFITTADGTVHQPPPRIYQEVNGKREEIFGGYRLRVEQESSGHQVLTFALGDYDQGRPLVIDPEIVYATYLGGSSTSTVANEGAKGVAVNNQGAAYIVGTTISADFPTRNPAQGALRGCGEKSLCSRQHQAGIRRSGR